MTRENIVSVDVLDHIVPLAMAVRLRRETTLSKKAIAVRVQLGPSNTANYVWRLEQPENLAQARLDLLLSFKTDHAQLFFQGGFRNGK